ncbi:MAG: replication-associated recombination protein A [Alphaproteobacteria bacterium]|nr:replication-associated recombination protein A [Alphaproteobacteria bacterium]OJV47057.1 MAG: AAA family ATPase [Alphaproteobacteria bacterium 43-37]
MSDHRPLAEQLRPETLLEVVGQEHLTSENGILHSMIDRPQSLVFWGPPGCGKTTIAKILAKSWDPFWEPISAVTASVSDLKKQFEQLKREKRFRSHILFIDEVHHFNRSQQDAFLPYLEDGTIVIIGATTQNPSFALNPAFLSRVSVIAFSTLNAFALDKLLSAIRQKTGLPLRLTAEAHSALTQWANGDGRAFIGQIENLINADFGNKDEITLDDLTKIMQQRPKSYDKTGDDHFNLISALHKAIRGSDVDGALYWLARMCVGSEDRAYIFRRLTRLASEDIGLADPHALPQVIAAWQAFERLGEPEGDLCLAQAVIYLATAPKSNATYLAQKASLSLAKTSANLPPPLYAMNAPTQLMKDLKYSQGYVYDHDLPECFSGLNYFPDDLNRQELYTPATRGFEREIQKRLEYWKKLRER